MSFSWICRATSLSPLPHVTAQADTCCVSQTGEATSTIQENHQLKNLHPFLHTEKGIKVYQMQSLLRFLLQTNPSLSPHHLQLMGSVPDHSSCTHQCYFTNFVYLYLTFHFLWLQTFSERHSYLI